ncbi:MAG: DNA polymerase III subunit delta [Peptoniphilaceae bacterium]|nr:DNA polymerase III subunit delta [Peptoniphilaceae bacterium]MDY6085437.1 DNA polymerase III subunit delta [Peptoniphilaceae bacterium]
MRYTEWIKKVDAKQPGRFLLAIVEEPFLWDTMQRVLQEDVLGGKTAFNYEALDGKTTSPSQFEAAVSTLPLFAEQRVVVLDHAPLGRDDAKVYDALLSAIGACLKTHPDHLLLVLGYHGAQPFRGKQFKTFEQELARVELSRLDGSELLAFIRKRYRAAGVTPEPGVVERVAESSEYRDAKLNRTLYDVQNLVDRTAALAQDGTLTLESAESVLVPPADRNIFALMDAVSARDSQKALLLFDQYQALGEETFRLFYLLARHVRNLLGVKRATEQNASARTTEERLKIKPFEYDKLRRAVGHFSEAELLAMHDALYTMETRVKTEPFRLEPALDVFFARLGQKPY